METMEKEKESNMNLVMHLIQPPQHIVAVE